jgi:hypothetical protein
VVAVSAPLDLADYPKALALPENRLYQMYFLGKLDVIVPGQDFDLLPDIGYHPGLNDGIAQPRDR